MRLFTALIAEEGRCMDCHTKAEGEKVYVIEVGQLIRYKTHLCSMCMDTLIEQYNGLKGNTISLEMVLKSQERIGDEVISIQYDRRLTIGQTIRISGHTYKIVKREHKTFVLLRLTVKDIVQRQEGSKESKQDHKQYTEQNKNEERGERGTTTL